MSNLKLLDFYAGIGGASVAAQKLGIKTLQFIEIDSDAQHILRSQFPGIPIHSDIRDYKPLLQKDIIQWHSFPCTGTSSAGKRQGLSHPDSALWRESLRCIVEGQPKFVVIEQPEGFIRRGLQTVCGALRVFGYSRQDIQIVSAAELGAGHERRRLFLIAYSDGLLLKERATCWDDQMRAVVKEIRDSSRWLTIERTSNESAYGIPRGLVRPFTVKNGTSKRLRARFLCGRSVTPPQAEVALRRVVYLNSIS